MTVEKPILFTDEMVRAILDGRKTVTRRTGATWANVKPGTVLWVRECFAFAAVHDDRAPTWIAGACREAGWEQPWAPTWYRSDGHFNNAIERVAANREWGGPGRWRPNIHMPRWACRLRLEVESVSVERSVLGGGLGQMAALMPGVTDDEARMEGFANRGAFLELWRKLHPDYNGVVYRVAFRVLP